MSCTIDVFNADFGTKDHALAFIKLFNEMLKEDLYIAHEISERDIEFKFDQYSISIDESPLFSMAERGGQLLPVIKRFLLENPDAIFSAYYSCSFTNCGDTTYIECTYNDGILTIETRWGELPYETYCEECEYDSDEEDEDYIVDLATWEEDKIYKCPNCGAVIEFEAEHDIQKIKIKQ